MKLNPYCILLLLFPLLSTQKCQNKSVTEPNQKVIENLAESIAELLPQPQPPPRQKESPWKPVARNVLAELAKMIHQYSNVTLDELIFVALCKDTGRTKVIMHMRVHIRNCQKNSQHSCKSDPPISAYCSWIGRLNGTAHRKLDGAVCYITGKISEEEEWTIATIDVCKLWRYADTKYYRLLIPVGIEKWKKQLLLYYPVPTDPSMRQELMKTMGQSHQSEHMNPQGRAGILGQGVLKHLGENLMELPILLRDNGNRREILLAGSAETWTSLGPFPLFYRKPKNDRKLQNSSVTYVEDYFYSLLLPVNGKKCDIDQLRKEMRQKHKLFNRQIYHPHETDNAWVKLKIYFLMVPRKSCLYNLNLNSSANHLHFEWKSYNDSRLASVKSIINSHFEPRETDAITAESYLQRTYYVFYLSLASAAFVVLSIIALTISLAGGALFFAFLTPIILALAGATALIYKRRWLSIDRDIESCDK